MEGKKVWLGFIIVIFSIWLWSDFETASGGVVFVGGFIALYYITKLALLAFAENSPGLKKRLFWVSEFQALFCLVAYNIFVLLAG